MDTEALKLEIPKRAARWAAEAATRREAQAAAAVAERDRRKAEWTPERIAAVQAEWRTANPAAGCEVDA